MKGGQRGIVVDIEKEADALKSMVEGGGDDHDDGGDSGDGVG